MDIPLVWDAANARADWSIAGAVPADGDLATAVLISLFTDRTAPPDFVLTDGTTDRRGWWADAYTGDPIGSHLWTLERSKKTSTKEIENRAKGYAEAALKWLIDDGIAKTVAVETEWHQQGLLAIGVIITQASGRASQFFFTT